MDGVHLHEAIYQPETLILTILLHSFSVHVPRIQCHSHCIVNSVLEKNFLSLNTFKMHTAHCFKICVFVFTFLITPRHVENAKILFLIPMSTRSEKHFFEPLILKLASNGHNMTVVTNSPDVLHHENVKEIVPISVEEIYGNVGDIGNVQDLGCEIN